MKSKLMLLLVATLVSAGLLTGCPENKPNPGPGSKKSDKAELIELNVADNAKIDGVVYQKADAIPLDDFEAWIGGDNSILDDYDDGELQIKTKIQETGALTISLSAEISPKAYASFVGPLAASAKPAVANFDDFPETSNVTNGQFVYVQVIAEDGTEMYYRIKVVIATETYTVTFDANHSDTGTGVVAPNPATRTVLSGGKVTLPTPPQRPNDDFKEWTEEKAPNSTVFTNQTIVTKDMTVYAQWVPLKSVTFNLNYTGAPAPTVVKVGEGKPISTQLPANPTRTDFEFDKWTVGQTATSETFTSATVITADITVYAQWKAYVNVTFSRNGAPETVTMPASRRILEGNAMGLMPDDPFWDAQNVFKEWNTLANGSGTAVTLTTVVTTSMTTIYAIWEGWSKGKDYVVDISTQHRLFQYATGTGSTYAMPLTTSNYITANPGGKNGNVQLTYPDAFDVNDYSKVTVKYNIFQGTTAATPGARVFGSSSYQIDAYFYQPWTGHGLWMTSDMMPASTTSGENTQIQKQEEKGVLLRLGGRQGPSEGATESNVTEQQYEAWGGNKGHTFDLPATWIPNPEGLHVNKAGGGSNGFIEVVEIKFHTKRDNPPTKPTMYIVTFDKGHDDAEGTPAAWTEANPKTKEVAQGAFTTAPAVAPTREGYRFVKWVTEKDGATEFVFATTAITGATTIYASWIQQFKVSFDTQGGAPVPAAIVVDKGATATLPTANLPEKSGYKFAGWFEAGSGGTAITEVVNVTADVTVYAQWEETVGVIFDANGGTFTGSATTVFVIATEGKIATLPASPTKAPEFFDKWTLDQAGSEAEFTTSTEVTTTITVYAQWRGWAAGDPLTLLPAVTGAVGFEYDPEEVNGIKDTGATAVSTGNNGQNVRLTFPAGFNPSQYDRIRVTAQTCTDAEFTVNATGQTALQAYFFSPWTAESFKAKVPATADIIYNTAAAGQACNTFRTGFEISTTLTSTPAGFYLNNRPSSQAFVRTMQIQKIEFYKAAP